MNVLLLCTHLNPGGITKYVSSLAGGLKRRNHNVFIGSSGGQLVDELLKQGIRHLRIPIRTKSEASPKILLSVISLVLKIKKYNIQIIHANTRVTQVLAFYLSRLTGAKFISTCHGFFKQRLSRRLFPCWGQKVIAISKAVEGHLRDDFHTPEDDIALIHNGIDFSRYTALPPGPVVPQGGIYGAGQVSSKNELKKQLGLRDGPVVGIIARLSPVKGHKFLIMAFKDILENIPQAQLLIVGDGHSKNELVNLAKNLNIDKNVYFWPSCLDTARYLRAMDVFVMPSLREGLGLSVIEAQAMGLPVVASCIGGINSLIEDGVNGLLVQPADCQAISMAILLCLRDKDLSQRLSQQARLRVKEKFSLETMVTKIEHLYKTITG